MRRRTVHGDHAAEADSQKTRAARQAERANRKILLARKYLDNHRQVDLKIVLFAKFRSRLLQQFDDLRAVDLRLARVHSNDEPVLLDRLESGQVVAQRCEVVGHDIVRVPTLHLVGKVPAFQIASKPQQILSQLHLCRQELVIVLQRFALVCCAFGKAVFAR